MEHDQTYFIGATEHCVSCDEVIPCETVTLRAEIARLTAENADYKRYAECADEKIDCLTADLAACRLALHSCSEIVAAALARLEGK